MVRTGATQVIVVGGGPAGSYTAWGLATAGIDVLLLDRARFPRAKPCGEYLSPQASRLLDAMGVLQQLESSGAAQLSGMIVRAPNGDRIHGEFISDHGFRGFRDRGLALRREVLDAVLLEQARGAGARVVEGVRVTDLLTDVAGRVTGVVARNGVTEEYRSAVVVGADGLRTVVGRRLGVAAQRRWPRRVAVVAHFRGVSDVGRCGEMHVERDGYAGIADVGGGESNVAVVIPVSRGREIRAAGRDPAEFLEQWVRRRAHLAPRFVRAERVGPGRTTGPFASLARRAWAPGAALAGDAADFFDPFTGEGVYAALRGAELLVPHILEALRAPDRRRSDRELQRYDRARRREFSAKWLVERVIGTVVAWPPLINRAAHVLSRRRDMADLLVGVAGDFVPAREVLRPGYLCNLVLPRGGRSSRISS